MASRARIRQVNRIVSHLPGVKRAAHSRGREIQGKAERLFASHDRPGGHEITGETQDTDYLVSIEGDKPHILEYGRRAYTREDGVRVGAMEGLRILGRAVE